MQIFELAWKINQMIIKSYTFAADGKSSGERNSYCCLDIVFRASNFEVRTRKGAAIQGECSRSILWCKELN